MESRISRISRLWALGADAATRMFAERYHVAVQHDDFLPFTGAGEDRFIGGVAEKYGIQLTMPADKLRTYDVYLPSPAST